MDSTKTVAINQPNEQTPNGKSGEKRSAEDIESNAVDAEEIGERSINKPQKLKSVKVEKTT